MTESVGRLIVTEKEYIEREALPAANTNDNDYADGWNECLEAINAIPAADVRPVVRAEFVRCGDGKGVPYMCSHCGRTTPANMVEIWGVNFCPNCGARME